MDYSEIEKKAYQCALEGVSCLMDLFPEDATSDQLYEIELAYNRGRRSAFMKMYLD